MRSDTEVDLPRSDSRCKSSSDASPTSSPGRTLGPRINRRKRSRDGTSVCGRRPFTPCQSSCPRGDGQLDDAGGSTDPAVAEDVRDIVLDILRQLPGLPDELARQLQRSRNIKGTGDGQGELKKQRQQKQLYTSLNQEGVGDGQDGSVLQHKSNTSGLLSTPKEGFMYSRSPSGTWREKQKLGCIGDITGCKHRASRILGDAMPEATPFSESRSFAAAVDAVRQRIKVDLNQALDEHEGTKKLYAERVRKDLELRNLSVESTFCDINGGDSHNRKARKVAVLASKCIVSLSSFSGEKRIRVCSGFVIQSDSATNTYKILSAATLVRSPINHNGVDSDLKVKVCLPSGVIADAFITMIDFHYNLVVFEVKSEQKLHKGTLVRDVITEGMVISIGRFYDDGSLMGAKGVIITESSGCDCSELLLSSCETTMAGVGGPLLNYSGHILGINFYGLKNTPFLSMAVVIRCLEQWQYLGKIARPYMGFSYSSMDAVPLKALEKCPYADSGLFISNVAKGSIADLAGLKVGDVVTQCAGKDLTNAPEFGALLLDICTEQMKTDLRKLTLELAIVKQDGNAVKITIDVDALGECNYYRWPVPEPSYNHKSIGREAFMQFL